DAIDDPVAADELAGRGPLLLGGGARRRKGGGLFQEPLRARPLVRPEQPIDGAPESGIARAGCLHEGGPLRKRAFQRPLEDRVDPVHPIAVHAISTGTDACTQPTTRRWPRAAIRSRPARRRATRARNSSRAPPLPASSPGRRQSRRW